ncbi:MAG: 1-acyl-sn-glycerol-3-phosphate acyltransferase [Chloroflexi bacterium]|nr:1-acyl-sn-glycerol-3-phosphate acyltransferase [Chloroflexota bacterium]
MLANKMGQLAIRAYTQHVLGMSLVKQADLPEGPKILAANHPTTTDPFYLLAVPEEPLTILITQMAFDAPVFGSYLHAAGHIPVVEGQGREAFEAALARLQAGGTIGVFPEGALSPREGGLGRGHTGAVRLARMADVPIVPIGIHLSRKRVRYVETTYGERTAEARWYTSGPYAMTVGEALWLDGDHEDRPYVRQQTQRLMEHIRGLAAVSRWRLASHSNRLSDSWATASAGSA